MLSFASARLRGAALLVLLVAAMTPASSFAAGAFAMGRCGAFGDAYDYSGEEAARAAALKKCQGDCTAVTMKHACAAFSIDMSNPCGPHGYAVRPQISASLNEATRECYKYGGK